MTTERVMTRSGEARLRTESMIDGLTVRSDRRFIAYGSVRGLIAECNSAQAAKGAVTKDSRACRSVGGYSDARVYWSVGGHWEPWVSDDE